MHVLPHRLPVLSLLALLFAACATEEDRIQKEIESGSIVVVSDGPVEGLKRSATYTYSSGSTVRLTDNRFDSFEIEGNLRGSLERQLRERGLVRGKPLNADYLVGYMITSDADALMNDAVSTMALPPSKKEESRPLARGAILIAVADPSSGTTIWRGAIEGAVDPTRTPDERAKRIDRAVEMLLSRL